MRGQISVGIKVNLKKEVLVCDLAQSGMHQQQLFNSFAYQTSLYMCKQEVCWLIFQHSVEILTFGSEQCFPVSRSVLRGGDVFSA